MRRLAGLFSKVSRPKTHVSGGNNNIGQMLNESVSMLLSSELRKHWYAAQAKEKDDIVAALDDYKNIIAYLESMRRKNTDIPLPTDILVGAYTNAARILTMGEMESAMNHVNKALDLMPQFEPALELKRSILIDRGKRIDDTLMPKR